MPDQDFNIKVVTTADTSGLRQVGDEMDRLNERGKRQSSLRGAFLAPVPEDLKTTEDVVKESEKAAAASFLTGANLGKARREAAVLVRELATGGNVMRTVGSLMGAFSFAITGAGIAALFLFEKIGQWAAEIRKTAEEQRALSREIDRSVKGYESIRTAAQWDKENEKIEDQIQLLRDKLKLTSNTTDRENIQKEIDARQRQQQDLAIQAQRGFERARAEEQTTKAIREQIEAMAAADKSAPVGVEAAKAKREEAEKNYDAVRKTEGEQLKARADAAKFAQQSADADVAAAQAKKDLLEARGGGSAPDIEAARLTLNLAEALARNMRELAEGSAGYVRQLDHGKDALNAELQTTKAILEYRLRAEQSAKAAAASALQQAVPGLGPQGIKRADPSVQAVLMNEQAAATAAREGRSKDVDLFQSSAQALKRGLTTDQQEQLRQVNQMMKDSGGTTDNPVIKAIQEQTDWMKHVWGY